MAVLEIDNYAEPVHKAVIAESSSEVLHKFMEEKKRKSDKGGGFIKTMRQRNYGLQSYQEGANYDNTQVKRNNVDC